MVFRTLAPAARPSKWPQRSYAAATAPHQELRKGIVGITPKQTGRQAGSGKKEREGEEEKSCPPTVENIDDQKRSISNTRRLPFKGASKRVGSLCYRHPILQG